MQDEARIDGPTTQHAAHSTIEAHGALPEPSRSWSGEATATITTIARSTWVGDPAAASANTDTPTAMAARQTIITESEHCRFIKQYCATRTSLPRPRIATFRAGASAQPSYM
jgi:hypothetical protein